MRLLHLFALISVVTGTDYIVDSFRKYVNPNVEPCDNFYRHACKLDEKNPGFHLKEFFEILVNDLKSNITELLQTVDIQKAVTIYEKNATFLSPSYLYLELCANKKDTTLFLEQLRPLWAETLNECRDGSCSLRIQEDPDCLIGLSRIESIMNRNSNLKKWKSTLAEFVDKLKALSALIVNISAHLMEDVQKGVSQTEEFITQMKKVASEWIKDTPWAIRNNVTESTINTLLPATLQTNYQKALQESVDQQAELETFYKNCASNFPQVNYAAIFCLMSTAVRYSTETVDDSFSLVNAFMDYPRLSLGFAFYHIAKNSDSMATNLGSTGYVAAHELSHVLIQGTANRLLQFFSETSKKCIQDQFNKTCTSFKEKSCHVFDEQLDDNGADMLGLQLAYNLLEKHYGSKLNEVYVPLGVTYQQLFFYSPALLFCEGKEGEARMNPDGSYNVHSSDYVRVNAMVAQHPGFKEAFQCSDDSKMMQSATEQCIIYGKDAPETKRH